MDSSQVLPELGEDMLIEVMKRIRDVRTLAKMRTLSKRLNLVSYSSTFTPIHSVSGSLLRFKLCGFKDYYGPQFIDSCAAECSHPLLHSLDFVPLPHVEILACSEATGLVHCRSCKPQGYRNYGVLLDHYVCKPTTREWLQIPNPKTKHEPYLTLSGLIVLRSNPLRYKIIRISWLCVMDVRSIRSYKCQVFDSDTPGKWRRLKDLVLHIEDGYWEGLESDPPITVNGNLHFMTTCRRVVSFDPLCEKWEFFSTPELSYPYPRDISRPMLRKYEGKLCFIFQETDGSIKIWVMDNYISKVWTARNPISLTTLGENGRLTNFLGFCASDVILFESFNNIVVMYNVKKNCQHGTTKSKMFPDRTIDRIFEFHSDFEKLGWKTEAGCSKVPARKRARR